MSEAKRPMMRIIHVQGGSDLCHLCQIPRGNYGVFYLQSDPKGYITLRSCGTPTMDYQAAESTLIDEFLRRRVTVYGPKAKGE